MGLMGSLRSQNQVSEGRFTVSFEDVWGFSGRPEDHEHINGF